MSSPACLHSHACTRQGISAHTDGPRHGTQPKTRDSYRASCSRHVRRRTRITRGRRGEANSRLVSSVGVSINRRNRLALLVDANQRHCKTRHAHNTHEDRRLACAALARAARRRAALRTPPRSMAAGLVLVVRNGMVSGHAHFKETLPPHDAARAVSELGEGAGSAGRKRDLASVALAK